MTQPHNTSFYYNTFIYYIALSLISFLLSLSSSCHHHHTIIIVIVILVIAVMKLIATEYVAKYPSPAAVPPPMSLGITPLPTTFINMPQKCT